jgi:hypothetical protein
MHVDIELVRAARRVLDDTNLSEIEVEDGDRKVRVARVTQRPSPMPPLPGRSCPPVAAPTAAPDGRTLTPADLSKTRSPRRWSAPPISRPRPGAKPFIEVGRRSRRATRSHHRSDEDDEPDPAPRAGTVTGDPDRRRPAGRIRPAARRDRVRPPDRCSRRSSSPTAARSRCASCAPAKELGIKTVAVHSTADADAMHVRLADEASASARRRRATATSTSPRSSRPARSPAPTRSIPATASSPRTPSSPRSRAAQHHLHRADGRAHPHHGRQDRGQAHRQARSASPRARFGRRGHRRDRGQRQAHRREIGYPVIIKAAAGGGGAA